MLSKFDFRMVDVAKSGVKDSSSTSGPLLSHLFIFLFFFVDWVSRKAR